MNHLDTQLRDDPDDHSDLAFLGQYQQHPYIEAALKWRKLELEELGRAEEECRIREVAENRLLEEARERREKEEEFKKEAIEDWKVLQKEEEEEEENKTKAKQEEDEEYKERMRKTLLNNGYSEEEIERIFKHGEKGKEKNHDYYHPGPPAHPAGAISMARPTFLKVNKKHIDPETLDAYEIEWEYDDVCIFHFHNTSS